MMTEAEIKEWKEELKKRLADPKTRKPQQRTINEIIAVLDLVLGENPFSRSNLIGRTRGRAGA